MFSQEKIIILSIHCAREEDKFFAGKQGHNHEGAPGIQIAKEIHAKVILSVTRSLCQDWSSTGLFLVKSQYKHESKVRLLFYAVSATKAI